MDEEAPKPTGRVIDDVSLDGALFAWDPDDLGPSLVRPAGQDRAFIACFSEEGKLLAFYRQSKIPFDRIVRIADTQAFLGCVNPQVGVILDPWFTPEGRLRYLEIKPHEQHERESDPQHLVKTG